MGETLTTNRLGQIAIVKVELRALQKDIIVSKPTIECRYDLVLDDGERLHRTQVKYAGSNGLKRPRGVVMVGLRKWRNLGRTVLPFYSASEIDLLLVYVRKTEQVLCFGLEVFDGRRFLLIRTEPSRNNQMKGCLIAANYVW